jgi:hypothetical protein
MLQKYVAERGVDHTLGSAERFTCNIEDMVHHIRTFGLGELLSNNYNSMYYAIHRSCDTTLY